MSIFNILTTFRPYASSNIYRVLFSKDNKTIFVCSAQPKQVCAYDISNIKNPVLLSGLTVGSMGSSWTDMVLSKDGNTLIVSSGTSSYVYIIDCSNVNLLVLKSSFYVHDNFFNPVGCMGACISEDGNTVFTSSNVVNNSGSFIPNLLSYDITNKSNPISKSKIIKQTGAVYLAGGNSVYFEGKLYNIDYNINSTYLSIYEDLNGFLNNILNIQLLGSITFYSLNVFKTSDGSIHAIVIDSSGVKFDYNVSTQILTKINIPFFPNGYNSPQVAFSKSGNFMLRGNDLTNSNTQTFKIFTDNQVLLNIALTIPTFAYCVSFTDDYSLMSIGDANNVNTSGNIYLALFNEPPIVNGTIGSTAQNAYAMGLINMHRPVSLLGNYKS